MFHFWRKAHRTIGVVACAFLLLIGITGFLLGLKREISWMRPSEVPSEPVKEAAELVAMETVVTAAVALGLKELTSLKDVDRIDYRPKQNVFKVVTKTGYKEIQVNGSTGQVVNVADRNDSLVESIHDLSWFHDGVRTYWLPVVALGLITLSGSGLYMYINPVLRRRKFKKSQSN